MVSTQTLKKLIHHLEAVAGTSLSVSDSTYIITLYNAGAASSEQLEAAVREWVLANRSEALAAVVGRHMTSCSSSEMTKSTESGTNMAAQLPTIISSLLEPALREPAPVNGFIIRYELPDKNVGGMMFRYLFGRILKTGRNGRSYYIYYPGYLHNIPHHLIVGGGRIFISGDYRVEPILEIMKPYVARVTVSEAEAYPCRPDTYVTAFQRHYRRFKRRGLADNTDWSRGLLPRPVATANEPQVVCEPSSSPEVTHE